MKKKLIILLQLLIATVLIGTSVYAAIDTTLAISTDVKTVKAGDEISVTMALKDVDSAKAVDSITGYINYKETVFETVTVNSIVKDADGTVTIGEDKLPVEDLTNRESMTSTTHYVGFNGNPSTSENDIKIVIHPSTGISTNATLLTIKFKVKSDATIGEIKEAITYDLFSIIAGDEKVSGISEKIDVVVQQVAGSNDDGAGNGSGNDGSENPSDDGSQNGGNDGDGAGTGNGGNAGNGDDAGNGGNNGNDDKNKPTNNPNSNTNTNTNKNTNTNTNTNTKVSGAGTNTVDNTIAGTVIPAAGAKVVIIPAIILILCAYVFYNRYMQYKEF